MNTNFKKYIKDLEVLLELGSKLRKDLLNMIVKNQKGSNLADFFSDNYQRWYTESQAVVRVIIPARYDEFNDMYKDHKLKNKTNPYDYFSIQNWMLGQRSTENSIGEKRFDDAGIVLMKFTTQLDILKSAQVRFESTLMDIRKIAQAELNKHGFCRGAGAVAGVVLEKHLTEVINTHLIKLSKKDPSISDFNDLLKNNNVIEIAIWRFIQHLADLRNKCDHSKSTDPTKAEVQELIDGVDKVCKTIF
jgi:hypothetical protein